MAEFHYQALFERGALHGPLDRLPTPLQSRFAHADDPRIRMDGHDHEGPPGGLNRMNLDVGNLHRLVSLILDRRVTAVKANSAVSWAAHWTTRHCHRKLEQNTFSPSR